MKIFKGALKRFSGVRKEAEPREFYTLAEGNQVRGKARRSAVFVKRCLTAREKNNSRCVCVCSEMKRLWRIKSVLHDCIREGRSTSNRSPISSASQIRHTNFTCAQTHAVKRIV